MKSVELIVSRIVEIANAADHSQAGPHIGLYSAVDELCDLGPTARLAGLKSVHRIQDMMARMGVAATVIAEEPGVREGIYGEALDVLCTSTREEDAVLLSELVHIFDDHVRPGILKSALVRTWKNASGALRDNLAYDLRRRGHNLVFGVWI